jgi:hypothetical protein
MNMQLLKNENRVKEWLVVLAGIGFALRGDNLRAAPSADQRQANTMVEEHRAYRVKQMLAVMSAAGLILTIVLELSAQHMRRAAHVATLLLLHYAASWVFAVSFGGVLFALTWWLHERWHPQRIALTAYPRGRRGMVARRK